MQIIETILCTQSNGRGRKKTVIIKNKETNEILLSWQDDGMKSWIIHEMLFVVENEKNGIRIQSNGGDIPLRNYVNYGIKAPEWLKLKDPRFNQDDLFDESGNVIPYELKDYSHYKEKWTRV